METPYSTLHSYDIGTVYTVESLSAGIIHDTWKVDASRGRYILQHVSPIFSPAVMEDTNTVLNFLRLHGCFMMEIVHANNGSLYVPDGARFWRLFTYVHGHVYESVDIPTIAYEAGKILGTYHGILQGVEYTFKHVRPIKHNIPALFQAYQHAAAGNSDPEIAVLLPVIDVLPSLDLPKSLRHTINHGDPKISNFIFTEDGLMARTMVDFDDCGNQYNVLYELGGAFRSWCQIRTQSAEMTTFSLPYFKAGLEGYCAGAQDFLNDEEWELLPQALQLIPLELASRFVRDIFEDCYFRWDSKRYPSRQAHNLARAQGQVVLYHDIVRQGDDIRRIIKEIRKIV
ncbi:phosphotransferase [Candidatus Uhrbacteria bacterium]|nr:phosphotransferase [Candidatus Uhrbacteria bacterium]